MLTASGAAPSRHSSGKATGSASKPPREAGSTGDFLRKAAAWFAKETGSIPSKDLSSCRRAGPPILIDTLCRVLRVSPSGYSAWRQRPLSARAQADVTLGVQIQAIHGRSRGTYGVPRVHAELAAAGVHMGPKRAARLMRAADVQGVSRRMSCRTTRRDPAAAPDLVGRDFAAVGSDRL